MPEPVGDDLDYNALAVTVLADLVISGIDSDTDEVCDHTKKSQWVCRLCATPNWDNKWACRTCWHQRSRADWDYPARKTMGATNLSRHGAVETMRKEEDADENGKRRKWPCGTTNDAKPNVVDKMATDEAVQKVKEDA